MNWTKHIARILAEAKEGETVVLQCSPQMVNLLRSVCEEVLSHKNIALVARPPDIQDHIRLRTLEGDPASPSEIQACLDYDKKRRRKKEALQEGLRNLLEEYYSTASDLEAVEAAEIIIQELVEHIGLCIQTTSKILRGFEVDPSEFELQARTEALRQLEWVFKE